jgi:hypothetical protein
MFLIMLIAFFTVRIVMTKRIASSTVHGK